MKHLFDIIEVYQPKPEDEKRFVAKHGRKSDGSFHRFENMYSKGDDYNKLFKGSTSTIDRKAKRLGYNAGDDDQAHYESVAQLFNAGIEGYGDITEDQVSLFLSDVISEEDRIELTDEMIAEICDLLGVEGMDFISTIAEAENITEVEALHRAVDKVRQAGAAVVKGAPSGLAHGAAKWSTGADPDELDKDVHLHDIVLHHMHSGPFAALHQSATMGPKAAAVIQAASLAGHLSYHVAKHMSKAWNRSGDKARGRAHDRRMGRR